MKKIIFALFLCFGIFSCSEDLGNYDYTYIESVGISDFEISEYTVLRGSPLQINTLDIEYPGGKTAEDYNYLWIAISEDKPIEDVIRDTLSRSNLLDIEIDLPVGTYALQIVIIDPTTELVSRQRTILRVVGSQEGWLFLEKDKNDNAEVSMYAKDPLTAEYVYVPSMLAAASVPMELRKGPRSLTHILKTPPTIKGYGVWVMTDGGVFILDTDNSHSYQEDAHINYMATDFDVKAERMYQTGGAFTANAFMLASDKMYFSNSGILGFGQNIAEVDDYNLSPYMAYCPSSFSGNDMFFDRSQQKFVQFYAWGQNFADVQGAPIGDDLIYMDYRAVPPGGMFSLSYALMESKTGKYAPVGKSYFITFKLEMFSPTIAINRIQNLEVVKNLNEHSKVVFPQASNLPYMFYSDGNEELYMTTGLIESPVTILAGKIEGKIVHLASRYFFYTYPASQYGEYIKFQSMIIVTTEKADGSGEVYFLTIPDTGKAHELELDSSVKTNSPVIHIDFQEKTVAIG